MTCSTGLSFGLCRGRVNELQDLTDAGMWSDIRKETDNNPAYMTLIPGPFEYMARAAFERLIR